MQWLLLVCYWPDSPTFFCEFRVHLQVSARIVLIVALLFNALILMSVTPLVRVLYFELKVPALRGTPHPEPTAGGSCCRLRVPRWLLVWLLWQFFLPVSASSDSPPSSAQSSAHQIWSQSIWDNNEILWYITMHHLNTCTRSRLCTTCECSLRVQHEAIPGWWRPSPLLWSRWVADVRVAEHYPYKLRLGWAPPVKKINTTSKAWKCTLIYYILLK